MARLNILNGDNEQIRIKMQWPKKFVAKRVYADYSKSMITIFWPPTNTTELHTVSQSHARIV